MRILTVCFIVSIYFSLNLVANSIFDPSTESKELAKANNEFAFKLFKELDDPNKKVTLFSPLSISSAMVMAASGASGETERQILDLLSINTRGLLGKSFGEYLDSMRYKEPQLEIANALVLQKPEGILEGYKSILKEDYDAEVFPGNVAEINSWCNEKTYGKIPEIIKELSPETVCVILNAVYFKGDWENPFNKEATRDMLFRLSGSESIQVPTMHQTEPFSTFRNDEFESILLPYKGDRVSMVIVMPPEGKSLDLLKRELTAEGFGDIWKNLSSAPKDKVFLTLPKFKIQSYYPLKKTLQAMGAVDPFGMRADFSKMSNIELLISEVLHKAVVEVDETGTVAAAVTAIVMEGKGMPSRPLEFKVDQPFMFFLVDNKTGAILFIARVNDPRE